MKSKPTFWNLIFGVIICLGIYSAGVRYARGLGAVSNMSDQFPWGIWIGFDVLCGVMLAAGGFIVTGLAVKYLPVFPASEHNLNWAKARSNSDARAQELEDRVVLTG